MPAEGVYHIGPRQLLSAVLLGGMFWFQFLSLQKIWLMPQDWTDQLAIPAVLTQLYCLTLLYLQTELFKKSAMQKEMDASTCCMTASASNTRWLGRMCRSSTANATS